MSEEKKAMTTEERLQLAAKLDKELDQFIEGLPKRKQPDSDPDENWLEEFDKHPFFMKKTPEPGEEMHPLYEGLQKLKYDPEENTALELAISYKDDGNFNFKHKNYRIAVIAYTEGIKANCGDSETEASLYNNRSAANWFLKNYRSCLRDCELALKLKPDYHKVVIRAANASFEIGHYESAMKYCDTILAKTPGDREMLDLRNKSSNSMKDRERDARKRAIAIKKKKKEEELLLAAITSRGIQIDSKKGVLKLEMLKPKIPQLADHHVFLNEKKHLIWPVVFIYPEYQTMDFVQEFSETDIFADQIKNVFAEVPEWDTKGIYKSDCVNAYYENQSKTEVTKVDQSNTLLQILQDKRYVVKGGTPTFIIFVRNSAREKTFLAKY